MLQGHTEALTAEPAGAALGELMPAKRSDLVVETLPDETLVFDPRSKTAHRLPDLVAWVFARADGVTQILRVVRAMRAERELGDDAPEVLAEILAELTRKGLLVHDLGSSRRAFMRQTSLLAALPAITSIVAPGPAAAVSIVGGISPVVRALPECSNTESYAAIDENPFRDTSLHPVSTFAVDVDTASYSNVRRFLRSGQLPPVDAVRVEEMLNYFRYDDPEPADGIPLACHAEMSECPWQPNHRLLRLGLQSQRIDSLSLPRRSLVFLLDVSGSMNAPDKLPLLRAAMGLLVETLRPEDQIAIAVYAGAAGLVLPPTPGSQAPTILAALDELQAGGSTNGGAGIELAYNVAARMARQGGHGRVILATDGDFNVGMASPGELVRLIERERQRGIFLSVLGFGTGNLKDSTMEQLADRGNGNYAYIDSLAEARKVLVREAGATLHTVARDVKIQLEWNPHEVQAYRLIGYENRLLAREDFDDDSKDAGEIGSGHHVTALYEVIESGQPSSARGASPLRYQQTAEPSELATSGELAHLKLRYQPPAGGPSQLTTWPLQRSNVQAPATATSDDFRLAAGVASFGMLLRRSPHLGAASWQLAHGLVTSTLAGDHAGYRQELMELIEEASSLADQA
ncbi:MAG: VWA domain-containing protein [Acidobacteriota bacterium]